MSLPLLRQSKAEPLFPRQFCKLFLSTGSKSLFMIIISLSYPLPSQVDGWTSLTRWEPTWERELGAIGEVWPWPRPCTVPYHTAPYRTTPYLTGRQTDT